MRMFDVHQMARAVWLLPDHELLDDVEQILKGKGFGEKSIDAGFLCCGFIRRIGGHGDKAGIGALFSNPSKQIKPVFVGELDFRQHDVNCAAGLHIGFECFSVFKR